MVRAGSKLVELSLTTDKLPSHAPGWGVPFFFKHKTLFNKTSPPRTLVNMALQRKRMWFPGQKLFSDSKSIAGPRSVHLVVTRPPTPKPKRVIERAGGGRSSHYRSPSRLPRM